MADVPISLPPGSVLELPSRVLLFQVLGSFFKIPLEHLTLSFCCLMLAVLAVCATRLVAQSCLTICDPTACCPSASSACGILQALVAGGGRVQIISHGKIYASNFHFFWAGVEVDLRSCGNWRVFLLNKVISFASLSSQATFMG